MFIIKMSRNTFACQYGDPVVKTQENLNNTMETSHNTTEMLPFLATYKRDFIPEIMV